MGTGWSVGRGVSQSAGSSRRRRRRWGGVQAVARARHPTGPGFKRAARAGGAGRRVHRPGPHPPGRPYPCMPGLRRGSGEGGVPCAPREHSDYIYQRVVSPETPHHPLAGYSEWPRRALSAGQKRHLAPASALPGFRPPALRPCGRLEPPITGPIRAIRASRGPIRPRVRAQESPGCSRGAQGGPPRHHPAYLPRSERCGGFRDGRPRRPGDAGTAPRPPDPPRPAHPALPRPTDQPVPSRRRRPLEPSPRGARHPGDHRCLAPAAAVAAA